MPKSVYVDNAWVTMHFNSGSPAYFSAANQGFRSGDCWYCHNELQLQFPDNPGMSRFTRCTSCGKEVEYKTLVMSDGAVKAFDVRSGPFSGNALVFGAIMHITLPIPHPEFDSWISGFEHPETVKVRSTQKDYVTDFSTRAINQTSDLLKEFIVKENSKPWARFFTPPMLSNAIVLEMVLTNRFGRLVFPWFFNLSAQNQKSLGITVDFASRELLQFLLKQSTKENPFLPYFLLDICREQLVKKWNSQILIIYGAEIPEFSLEDFVKKQLY